MAPLDRLVVDLRLPFELVDGVEGFSPDGGLVVAAEPAADGLLRLTLRRVPLYGIVSIPRRS